MDAPKAINLFTQFLEQNYQNQIKERLRKDKKSITIEFYEISKFDLGLGEYLLNDAEEAIKALEIALGSFVKDNKEFKPRIIKLPDSTDLELWKIRNINKGFIRVQGYISKIGPILLRPIKRRYECPSCGNIINILALDRFTKASAPKACGCGRRGEFRFLSQELIEARRITVEEDIMEIGKRQEPRQKLAILEYDLTSPSQDKKQLVGKKVILNGYLDLMPIDPKKSDLCDTYIVVNSIEFIERGWKTIKYTPKEVEKFKKIPEKENFLEFMSKAILPGFQGEEQVKHALLLQMAGSQNIYDGESFLEEISTKDS